MLLYRLMHNLGPQSGGLNSEGVLPGPAARNRQAGGWCLPAVRGVCMDGPGNTGQSPRAGSPPSPLVPSIFAGNKEASKRARGSERRKII